MLAEHNAGAPAISETGQDDESAAPQEGGGGTAVITRQQKARHPFIQRVMVVYGLMRKLRERIPSQKLRGIGLQQLMNDTQRKAPRYSDEDLVELSSTCPRFFSTLGTKSNLADAGQDATSSDANADQQGSQTPDGSPMREAVALSPDAGSTSAARTPAYAPSPLGPSPRRPVPYRAHAKHHTHAMPCHTTPHHATPCHAVPRHAAPCPCLCLCRTTPYHTNHTTPMPCHAMLDALFPPLQM